MKLTAKQIETIVGLFFQTRTEIPGALNIARHLLETGSCIVAGNDRIWLGGVGHYIRAEDVPESFDCMRLVLDVDKFLSSGWARETLRNKANQMAAQIDDLNTELVGVQRLRQSANSAPRTHSEPNAEQEAGEGCSGATFSRLDLAVLAGIRDAAKAGMPPIALAVHSRDAAEDTIGGLPVMTAGTLQFDDWSTGCKYLPLFGPNNVATLEAERAFMEAVSFSLEKA